MHFERNLLDVSRDAPIDTLPFYLGLGKAEQNTYLQPHYGFVFVFSSHDYVYLSKVLVEELMTTDGRLSRFWPLGLC